MAAKCQFRIGFVCAFIFFHGVEASNIVIRKVMFDPVELGSPSVKTYSRNMTELECESLLFNPAHQSITLVCRTPSDQCLLSNARYSYNYDDESRVAGYKCYSTIQPTINIKNALAACGGAPICCPPPFRATPHGCIFVDTNRKNFLDARNACRAYWPTADLYKGRPNTFSSFHLYLVGAWPTVDAWLGATIVSGQWQWVGGDPVTAADWASGQPGTVGNALLMPIQETIPPGTPTECACLQTVGDMGLKAGWCRETHHFICQIT